MFKCSECGYEAKSKAGLAGHIRLAHEKPTVDIDRKIEYKEAFEEVFDILSKELDKRFEVLKKELYKELEEVIKKLAIVLTEVIGKEITKVTRKEIAELWKAHEKTHKALEKLCEKVGICPLSIQESIIIPTCKGEK